MTKDIMIGGVSLHSLTSKQLIDTINECEQILEDRMKVRVKQDSRIELLKPGLKKEIQSTFQDGY